MMRVILIRTITFIVAVMQFQRAATDLGASGRSARWSLPVLVTVTVAFGVFALLAVRTS